MFKKNIFKNKIGSVRGSRGQVLLITVILMSIALAAVLSLNIIATKQIKIAGDVKESAVALVGADTGAEYALFEFWRDAGAPQTCNNCQGDSLSNGASYSVNYNFSTNPRSVISAASFRGVRRAFQLSF